MSVLPARLRAAVVDGVLVLSAAVATQLASSGSIVTLEDPIGTFSPALAGAAVVLVVVPSLFSVSVGKYLTGLRVARPARLGRLRAALKYLVLLGVALLPFQPYLLIALVLLSSFYTSGRRSVLDLAFGTSVVPEGEMSSPRNAALLHPEEDSEQ